MFGSKRKQDRARAQDQTVRRVDLVKFAAHPDPGVRAVVASRTDCPLGAMIALAQEDDQRVLLALANNAALPLRMLEDLASNRHAQVRAVALTRLQTVPR